MTPELERFIAKARKCLEFGRVNIGSGVGNDAGRNAYLAAFHAAQALIFHRTGRVSKTHNGVRTEFGRLVSQGGTNGAELHRFLARAYNLKAAADYEFGSEADIPLDRASAALDEAERFVAAVLDLIG